jgi:hypothetical protein
VRKIFVLAAFAGVLMMSCKKSDTNSNAKVSDTIQSKWNVTQNGTSPIYSIEFLYGNTYIIQDIAGEFHKSNYSIQGDNKTVILNDYGSLEVTSLSSSSLQFKLKPNNYPTALALSATAAPKINAGSNTSVLCGKSWLSYKDAEYNGSGYDTIYYPQSQSYGIVKREVIFSINKTYFVMTVMDNYGAGYDTTYYNNNWDWDNSSQTRISYGVAPYVGHVAIDVLRSNELDMHETDQSPSFMLYFLH